VQIPTEASDDENQTADSSPHATANANAVTPIRTGAVLPPPSPSAASALLSAGATGPPNPFARPAPPVTNGAFGTRSEIETPKSALPSRFMSDQLLGSPSSFEYWGFGKDNTLPSPLAAINFGQTPIAPNGPSFRDDDSDRKRKVSDGVDENTAKRIKA
jgi:MADS-box transcription factor